MQFSTIYSTKLFLWRSLFNTHTVAGWSCLQGFMVSANSPQCFWKQRKAQGKGMLILYMRQNEAHPYKTARYQEWMSNQTGRAIHLGLNSLFPRMYSISCESEHLNPFPWTKSNLEGQQIPRIICWQKIQAIKTKDKKHLDEGRLCPKQIKLFLICFTK